MAATNSRIIFRNAKNFNVGNARNKSFNSDDWLKRRHNDIYIEKAKRENYRCRSAFKLIEIDDRYKLLEPGLKVLDVGASPGSWSQVLATRTNSNGQNPDQPRGLVIATDISFIHKIEGVITLPNSNFREESSQKEICRLLGDKKLDFVFSDMAPAATGVKSLDQENILNLVYPVLFFAVQHLQLGGGCLIKIWEGKHKEFAEQMKMFFRKFNFVKPNATYDSSSELYLLGRDFIGVNKNESV